MTQINETDGFQLDELGVILHLLEMESDQTRRQLLKTLAYHILCGNGY